MVLVSSSLLLCGISVSVHKTYIFRIIQFRFLVLQEIFDSGPSVRIVSLLYVILEIDTKVNYAYVTIIWVLI